MPQPQRAISQATPCRMQTILINYQQPLVFLATPFQRATTRWCSKLYSKKTQVASIPWHCQIMPLELLLSNISLVKRSLKLVFVGMETTLRWDKPLIHLVSPNIRPMLEAESTQQEPRQPSLAWILMRKLAVVTVTISLFWPRAAPRRKSNHGPAQTTRSRRPLWRRHWPLAPTTRFTRPRMRVISTNYLSDSR